MSTSCDVPSTFEQRTIIWFLRIEKCSAAEIHKRLKSTYGNDIISIQHVRKWHRTFEGGQTSITNNERVGKPVSPSTEDLNAQIDAVIQSNRNVRLLLIANKVNDFYGTVQKIVTEVVVPIIQIFMIDLNRIKLIKKLSKRDQLTY